MLGNVTSAKPHRHGQSIETARGVGQREFGRYADAALQSRLDIAANRLAEEFDGLYDRETIQSAVEESARALWQATRRMRELTRPQLRGPRHRDPLSSWSGWNGRADELK